jgi:phosphoribosylformylglycinamidine cyclo-ligase
MHRTFNCGIGMVIVVDSADKENTLSRLAELGEQACVIGEIVEGQKSEPYVELIAQ